MRDERIDETEIRPLLEAFYERVRKDAELGAFFESIVEDWHEHLGRIEEFWSSLMLTTGRYKGNPVAIHMMHAQKIRPEMFSRWLDLWRQTTSEMLSPAIAFEMQAKAGRIAERLAFMMYGPHVARFQSPASTEAPPPSPEPYRITTVFDETTVPSALLNAHATKPGVWGVIRIIAGQIRYQLDDGPQCPVHTLDAKTPGLIRPQQPHHLDLLGPVRFQVEFYDRDPSAIIRAHQ